jgi:hypothetical protein
MEKIYKPESYTRSRTFFFAGIIIFAGIVFYGNQMKKDKQQHNTLKTELNNTATGVSK